MGKLIDQEKRARAKGAKKERIARILEAASFCFVHLPFAEVTLDGIGQRAKVRQGLPTLYFCSREELFLNLLNRELDAWCEDIKERLAGAGPLSPSQLAGLVVDSLAERRTLTRLLSLLPGVLEQGGDVSVAMAFGERQHRRVATLGEAIEGRCSAVGSGQGAAFMRRVFLLVTGLEPAAHPVGAAALSSWDGERSGGALDFETELAFLLERVLGAKD